MCFFFNIEEFIYKILIELEYSYTNLQIDKPEYLSSGSTIVIQIYEFNGINSIHGQVFAYWNYEIDRLVEVNDFIELTERMRFDP